MFYKRQLSSFNYCLYNGRTQNGTMALWDETLAHRGVDEVGSVILLYIQTNFVLLQDGQTRELVFYCDRCRGQTNNYQILCLFKLLIRMRYFSVIQQKLMPTGHSYLPCDRLFGLIEQRKKVCIANVPRDWADIIYSTAVRNPFPIQQMTQQNMMQIKTLERLIPRPTTLRVTESHLFRMTAEEPSVIESKTNYAANGIWIRHIIRRPFARGRILQRPLWTHAALANFALARNYTALLPISYEKFTDLQSMLQCMMPEFRPFYQNLPHLPRPRQA
jgi:hypothetical protein